jgi:membrane-associated phospholipid phosphatase
MRYLLLVLIVVPELAQGQHLDSVRQRDSFRFADGVVYTYTSPSRWKGKDWIKLGGVLVGTAALTLADQPLRNFWVNQDSKVLDGINTVGYHYGKPYSAALFTGGFYLAGMLFKSEWAKETGLMLGTSLLSAGLLEMTLKPVVGRARPSTGEGNYELTFFNKEAGFHSFPSGHASMAFTISMVMVRRVESVPVKIFFYSLAASTAVCRLYSDAHWISDVAFGGTIAWFCSDVALKRISENRFRPAGSKPFQWKIYPYPSGLTVKATF